VIDNLLAIRNLEDDWDGRGAVAPDPAVVDWAMTLALGWRTGGHRPADFANAGASGTVLFEWHDPDEYTEVEVVAPGEAELRVVRKDVDAGAVRPTERSVPAGALAPLLTKLDSYALLPDRWNGYRAPAPCVVAIRHAKALTAETNRLALTPERVEPSAMGGVGVTFEAGPREVVVEFYNNGTAHALFSDDATGEMDTRSVSLSPNGYRELINSVRKYLHGE
jgi:hypothetical protein